MSRSLKARYLLNYANREIHAAKQKLIELQQQENAAHEELPELQAELRKLRDSLESTQHALEQEVAHNLIMNEYIENQKIKVNSLCIR